MANPKISLIIPTRNGGKYLPYCLESIISQDYNDVEIVVSNNCSQDNTSQYLETITDKRVKVVRPSRVLSMAEHYEFALLQTTGQWVMIIGDDDGVAPYFFELADFLIKKAEEKNLKLINARMAYFFWKGCEELYKDAMLNFNMNTFLTVENIKLRAFECICGLKNFFEIPQMYTKSLFNRTLIEKVRLSQNGDFYTAITPDANGAAIAASCENKYLDCKIPFSWGGTSPKSYGILGEVMNKNAVVEAQADTQKRMEEMMNLSYHENKFSWREDCGNIKIVSCVLYLYEALLKSSNIQTKSIQKFIRTKMFKRLAFAGILKEIENDKKNERVEMLKEICKINNISFNSVYFVYRTIIPIFRRYFNILDRKIYKKYKSEPEVSFSLKRSENLDFTLADANTYIENKCSILVKNFILGNV